jgi:di/tricarboxylate transporter
LVSGALRDAGLRPFQLFDFTPVGAAVMLVGIVFMALVGRHLLPHRDPAHGSPAPADTDLQQLYELRERLFFIHVPADSVLSGKTLTESRLGSALGLNVIAIFRHGQTHLSPDPTTVLHAGDRLLVEGRLDWLNELRGRRHVVVEPNSLAIRELISSEIGLAEGRLSPTSSLAGQTLLQSHFRHRFGAQVLAMRRGGLTRRTNLQDIPLQPGDTLLLQGPHAQLEALRNTADFDSFRLVSDAELAESYRLHERVIVARVPPDSILVGRSLAERRLGDAFGLTVLGLIREGTTRLLPDPATPLEAEDTLLVEGKPEDLLILRGLQELDIDTETPLNLRELESERVGLAEVVLSPHTTLVGRTMRELHFREKYGLTVLAIWREGRAYRSNLRNMPLRFGDALLLYGPRENVKLLASEPDFLVLTPGAPAAPRPSKAPLAGLLMAAVIVPVMLGWLPISIAAVLGAAGMVVTGCLTMEDAYRFIDWRAVFLIAGMLPLAMAIEQTGAARFLADSVVTVIGRFGPMGVMASLFMLTALAAQVMPTPAVAVLMAPMVIDSATDLGVSPHAFMMTLAMSASASFMSPITHPVNVMIMGPGGYRFTDYTKVGFPLTLVVLAVVLLVVPRFWPLYP